MCGSIMSKSMRVVRLRVRDDEDENDNYRQNNNYTLYTICVMLDG